VRQQAVTEICPSLRPAKYDQAARKTAYGLRQSDSVALHYPSTGIVLNFFPRRRRSVRKDTVTLTMDHSRPKGLKHCQFKNFLEEAGPEYNDVFGYSAVI
jgi:hypothetical protein